MFYVVCCLRTTRTLNEEAKRAWIGESKVRWVGGDAATCVEGKEMRRKRRGWGKREDGRGREEEGDFCRGRGEAKGERGGGEGARGDRTMGKKEEREKVEGREVGDGLMNISHGVSI